VYTDKMRDLYTLIDPATIPVGMTAADLGIPSSAATTPRMNNAGQIAGTADFYGSPGTSGLYAGRVFVVTPQ